mmetsp:Transcript_107321/g.239609  ORF Transcript_107321/g.239609 Transcript_107321/m.239609 type:complete len:206 (+) Transcript_107321:382-999(+)
MAGKPRPGAWYWLDSCGAKACDAGKRQPLLAKTSRIMVSAASTLPVMETVPSGSCGELRTWMSAPVRLMIQRMVSPPLPMRHLTKASDILSTFFRQGPVGAAGAKSCNQSGTSSLFRVTFLGSGFANFEAEASSAVAVKMLLRDALFLLRLGLRLWLRLSELPRRRFRLRLRLRLRRRLKLRPRRRSPTLGRPHALWSRLLLLPR